MVMLSNCHHTYAVILPRLVDNLNKHGYPDMENVYQVSFSKIMYGNTCEDS